MRFEIQVEAKDLFRFNMYHIYHTFSGVLGMVISIAALVGAVLTYGTVNTTYTVALLLVGCMVHADPSVQRIFQVQSNREVKDLCAAL